MWCPAAKRTRRADPGRQLRRPGSAGRWSMPGWIWAYVTDVGDVAVQLQRVPMPCRPRAPANSKDQHGPSFANNLLALMPGHGGIVDRKYVVAGRPRNSATRCALACRSIL